MIPTEAFSPDNLMSENTKDPNYENYQRLISEHKDEEAFALVKNNLLGKYKQEMLDLKNDDFFKKTLDGLNDEMKIFYYDTIKGLNLIQNVKNEENRNTIYSILLGFCKAILRIDINDESYYKLPIEKQKNLENILKRILQLAPELKRNPTFVELEKMAKFLDSQEGRKEMLDNKKLINIIK